MEPSPCKVGARESGVSQVDFRHIGASKVDLLEASILKKGLGQIDATTAGFSVEAAENHDSRLNVGAD